MWLQHQVWVLSLMVQIDPNRVFTDKDWTDPNYKGINAYIRAKTLAEQATRNLWNRVVEMTLAVVNPGLILGPLLDPKDTGVSCEGIKQMFTGELPMYPRLGFSVVDVRDVASCQILAMEKQSCRRAIFMWWRLCMVFRFGSHLARAMPGSKIPSMNMPNWLVHLFGLFNGGVRQLRMTSTAHNMSTLQRPLKYWDGIHVLSKRQRLQLPIV